MRTVFFFLGAFLKRPVIWLAAAVMILVAVFSFSTETLHSILPCALYCGDEGEVAQSIAAYLEDNGYTICEDRDEVIDLILQGKADCGIILREGFDEKLQKGSLRNCTELLISERSQKVSTYKLMTAVAIYQKYMPYTAAQTANDFGYDATVEDINAYQEQVLSMVNPLEFHITSIDGKDIEEKENFELPVGVISISCFAIFGFLCVIMIRRNALAVRQRFQSGKSWFLSCVLGQCAATGIFVYAASVAGILVSSGFYSVPVVSLLLAFLPYLAILIVLFSVLTVIPLPDPVLVCAIAMDAALSLLLCPLYHATNLLMGILGPLRVISVPYLAYLFMPR